MKKSISGTFATLLLAGLFAVLVPCAHAANGNGTNYCINVTNTPPTWGDGGESVFTNTCNQSVVLIVANSKGIWDPELIQPGSNETRSSQLGPFRYFACTEGSNPVDAQGNFARYNTSEYYCK